MKKYLLITVFVLLNNFLFAQSYGIEERTPNTAFKVTFSGDTLADMELQQVFKNITLSEPVHLANAGDGSDRIFVVERRGIVNVFANDTNVVSSSVFLDIESQVNSSTSETGLLSIAFHPNYNENGKFYVYYTFNNVYSRIAEFSVSADSNVADLASERAVLELQQPAGNHNGGQIAFGPDGYLYVSFGDGGGSGDTYENGQDPTTMLGAIIRIDVDSTSGGNQYAIPADNPFVGNSNGWKEEIFAYGLRNTWRFSFDPLLGTLWAADVGQGQWEEVDIIESGKNYGWNIMEGTHCFNASSCDTTGLTMPIVEYYHSVGQSITGGFVYRGTNPALQRLYGVYVYGDYVSGRIWGLKYENKVVTENKLIAESPSFISSFGTDEAGELYVLGYDGIIYRFVEKSGTAPTSDVPTHLAGSGLYSDIENQVVSPGIIEYSVNSPLWSDDAYKRRYLALPDTTKIEFSQDGFWSFPAEAVVVKEFYLEMEKDNPASRSIVETRLLVKHSDRDQWSGFTYLWNEDKTDAVLLDSDSTVNYTITDPSAPGGSYEQTWYYPSREECFRCHTSVSGIVLGPTTAQMNKDHDYDSVTDNQLRTLNHIHMFTENIGEDYTGFPQLPNPTDTNYSIEDRARSYLDANCASCHLPGGPGRTNMDLRYSTALANANIIDVPVEIDNMGIPNALRVNSGKPDSSILYLRMMDLGEHRMPPLGTLIVDETGTAIVRSWIDTLGMVSGFRSAHHYVASDYKLTEVYPNPFNPITNIAFEVPNAAKIELYIFDVSGRLIKSLNYTAEASGSHRINWDATNHYGKRIASGVYFVKAVFKDLKNNSIQKTQSSKLVLLK